MSVYANKPPQKEGGSSWLKGCCIGCVAVVLIFAILVVIGLRTVFKARPAVPPETFLTANADLFAVFQLMPDDEAVIRVLQESAKNQPAQQRRNIPVDQKQIEKNLQQILPIHAVVTARYVGKDEVSEDESPIDANFDFNAAISANPKGFLGRMIVGTLRWALATAVSGSEDQGGSIQKHGGTQIGTNAAGASMAVVDNNLLVGDSVDVLKEWIDRIDRQKKAQEKVKDGEMPLPPVVIAEGLKGMYDRCDHKAPVYFACLNTHGEIGLLLEGMEKAKLDSKSKEEQEKIKSFTLAMKQTDIASESVIVVGGIVRITGPDKGGFDFFIECRDEGSAKKLAAQFEAGLAEKQKETGIEDLSVTTEGALVTIKFTKSGLQKTIQEMSERRR